MRAAMTEFRLTPEVFTILSGLVEERLGLHYTFRDRDLFAEKVAQRALEARPRVSLVRRARRRGDCTG